MREADCLGIVVLYAKLVLNLDFGFAGWGVLDSQQRAETFNKERSKWLQVESPDQGDVVVLYPRNSKNPDHYGIAIDNKNILHSGSQFGHSSVQLISDIAAYFHKIEYYRWPR